MLTPAEAEGKTKEEVGAMKAVAARVIDRLSIGTGVFVCVCCCCYGGWGGDFSVFLSNIFAHFSHASQT